MQAILQGEFLVRGIIRHVELESKGAINGDDEFGGERGKTRRFRIIRQTKTHAHTSIRRRCKLLNLPTFDSSEPMLSQPFAGTEPWDDHRNATANGFIFGEAAA